MEIVNKHKNQITKYINVYVQEENIIVAFDFESYYVDYKKNALKKIDEDIFNFINNSYWERIIRFVIFYPLYLYFELIDIEDNNNYLLFVKRDEKKTIDYVFKNNYLIENRKQKQ